MKVTILIPARMAATRFPGKPLSKILGKPMIQWVYERASRSKADAVIVATDAADIYETVLGFGGQAVMTRDDHVNGTTRIAEAAAGLDTDLVINVQGDEPTIQPHAINAVMAPLMADPTLEMATLAEPISSHEDIFNPNIVKVVCNQKGHALYFSRAPIPYHKHLGMTQPTWPDDGRGSGLRHIGVYGFRKQFLLEYVAQPECVLETLEGLEQLRALHMGARIAVVETKATAVGVDNPADVALAEDYLKNEEGN